MLEKLDHKHLLTKTNLMILIFGILPAAGYLVGISFYQGRLSAFGVSSDTFPLALQDIYVEAFWAIGWGLLNLMRWIAMILSKVYTVPGVYWTIGLFVAITVIVYFPVKHKSILGFYLLEKLQPAKKVIDYLDSEKNALTKAISITGGISYFLISALWLGMFVGVGWVGIPTFAYYQGQDLANKKINLYLEKGCYLNEGERWSNCRSLLSGDGKQIYEGILVAHTHDYVAFFNKKGSFVSKFPDNAVIVTTFQTK